MDLRRPGLQALATDVSEGALEVAARNAARHGVEDRLTLRPGDLYGALEETDGPFDAILSNPPYIVRGDPDLEEGVLRHEPAAALFVEGDDPLAVFDALASGAPDHLAPGGWLLAEVGHRSGAEAARRLEALGYEDVRVAPDLARIDRVVLGRRRG